MKLPVFPKPLIKVMTKLPTLPISAVMTGTINLIAWRTLRDLDWSSMRGRRFCVHIKDAGIKTYFSVTAKGFVPQVTETADVTFTATAEDFMRLALRQEDPDTLFFNRRLLIEGNTDLGLTVKNMLDSVELGDLVDRLPAGFAYIGHKLKASQFASA